MRFYNYTGPKTKDKVLVILDNCINAYNALKKVGISNSIFENGNASCVDVVEEFENLKRVVNAFADKGKHNNDLIVEYQGWDFNILFHQKICTYDDLNKALFERIDFLKTALRKEEIKYIEKPISTIKSIDKNTFFTSVISTFAISSAFLTQVFCWKWNLGFGIGAFVAAILMICFKKRLFGEIK